MATATMTATEKPKPSRHRDMPQAFSPQEMALLLRTPNVKVITGLRLRVVLEILYRAGLRVNELCSLRVGDVDLRACYLRVHRGKGGKSRMVVITPELSVWLQRWMRRRKLMLEEANVKSEWLMCATFTKKLTAFGGTVHVGDKPQDQAIWLALQRLKGKAGIEGRVSAHVFRHTFASRCLEAGMPITDLQMMLGHHDLNSTMIYVHANPAHVRGFMVTMGDKFDQMPEPVFEEYDEAED